MITRAALVSAAATVLFLALSVNAKKQFELPVTVGHVKKGGCIGSCFGRRAFEAEYDTFISVPDDGECEIIYDPDSELWRCDSFKTFEPKLKIAVIIRTFGRKTIGRGDLLRSEAEVVSFQSLPASYDPTQDPQLSAKVYGLQIDPVTLKPEKGALYYGARESDDKTANILRIKPGVIRQAVDDSASKPEDDVTVQIRYKVARKGKRGIKFSVLDKFDRSLNVKVGPEESIRFYLVKASPQGQLTADLSQLHYKVEREEGCLAITLGAADPETNERTAQLHAVDKNKDLPLSTVAVLLPHDTLFRASTFAKAGQFIKSVKTDGGRIFSLRAEVSSKKPHVFSSGVPAPGMQLELVKRVPKQTSEGGEQRVAEALKRSGIKAVAFAFDNTLVGRDCSAVIFEWLTPFDSMINFMNELAKKGIQPWIVSGHDAEAQGKSLGDMRQMMIGHSETEVVQGKVTIQFYGPTTIFIDEPSTMLGSVKGAPLIAKTMGNAKQKISGVIKAISAPTDFEKDHHLTRIAEVEDLPPQKILFIDAEVSTVENAISKGFSGVHCSDCAAFQLNFDLGPKN